LPWLAALARARKSGLPVLRILEPISGKPEIGAPAWLGQKGEYQYSFGGLIGGIFTFLSRNSLV
jgi:hypothetical protein